MLPFPILNNYGNIIPKVDTIKKVLVNYSFDLIYVLKVNGDLYIRGNNSWAVGGIIGNSFSSWVLSNTNVDDLWVTQQNAIIKKKDNTYWSCGALYPFSPSVSGAHYWTDRSSLFSVPISKKIKDIQCTSAALYILTNTNELYAMGSNRNGELGLSNTTDYTTLQYITNNVYNFSVKDNNLGVIKNDFKYYFCGRNNYYEQGNGVRTGIVGLTLSPATKNSNMRSVLLSGDKAQFLSTSNKIMFTGASAYGDSGDGIVSYHTYTSITESTVSYPSGVTSFSPAYTTYKTTMLGSDALYFTGRNLTGSAGLGISTDVSTFTAIPDTIGKTSEIKSFNANMYIGVILMKGDILLLSGRLSSLGGTYTDTNVYVKITDIP